MTSFSLLVLQPITACADQQWSGQRGSLQLVVIADEPAQHLVATLIGLRRRGYYAPAVILTHRATQELRRQAFAVDVRDVITLPARAYELCARLRVALGDDACDRGARAPAASIRAGGIILDTAAREVRDRAGNIVAHLTRREAALLGALMQCPGQRMSRQALLDCLWGESAAPYISALDVYVHRVRRKLTRPERGNDYIHTVRGYGYIFEARRVPRDAPTAARVAVAPVSQAR